MDKTGFPYYYQSTSGANLKKQNNFFAEFCTKFATFCVFSAFQHKNAENDYFDQCLGCAAPKCPAKYTTRKQTRAQMYTNS